MFCTGLTLITFDTDKVKKGWMRGGGRREAEKEEEEEREDGVTVWKK